MDIYDSYRKTDHDFRKFASDLNKWVNEKCVKTFSVSNIDMIIHKAETNKWMLIESKYDNESTNKQEMKIFAQVHKGFTLDKDINYMGGYIVYTTLGSNGEFKIAEIRDISDNMCFKITKEEDLKKFLEMDFEPNSIKNKYHKEFFINKIAKV